MKSVKRGEIWLVDLGMRAKVRPVLVLSVEFRDDERALISFVARTTHPRGTRFEVEHHARNFRPGVFDCQSIGTNDVSDFVRRLSVASDEVLTNVEDSTRAWLEL